MRKVEAIDGEIDRLVWLKPAVGVGCMVWAIMKLGLLKMEIQFRQACKGFNPLVIRNANKQWGFRYRIWLIYKLQIIIKILLYYQKF